MKDVPKLFEYIKSSNVGASEHYNTRDDVVDEDEANSDVGYPQEDYNKEDDLISFGYHIYNGL